MKCVTLGIINLRVEVPPVGAQLPLIGPYTEQLVAKTVTGVPVNPSKAHKALQRKGLRAAGPEHLSCVLTQLKEQCAGKFIVALGIPPEDQDLDNLPPTRYAALDGTKGVECVRVGNTWPTSGWMYWAKNIHFLGIRPVARQVEL